MGPATASPVMNVSGLKFGAAVQLPDHLGAEQVDPRLLDRRRARRADMPEPPDRRQVVGVGVGAIDRQQPLHDRRHGRHEVDPVLGDQPQELVRRRTAASAPGGGRISSPIVAVVIPGVVAQRHRQQLTSPSWAPSGWPRAPPGSGCRRRPRSAWAARCCRRRPSPSTPATPLRAAARRTAPASGVKSPGTLGITPRGSVAADQQRPRLQLEQCPRIRRRAAGPTAAGEPRRASSAASAAWIHSIEFGSTMVT